MALTKKLPEAGDHPVIGKDVIYRVFFHGPAYRVLESVWGNSGSAVGLFPEDLPTNHVPETSDTLMAPRLVELCFQTAGVWEIGRTGKMGLPREVARVRRFGNGGPAQGRLQALVEPAGDDTGETGGGETGGTFRAWVVDEAGTVHVALEGYRTIELPGGVDTAGAKEFRSALR